MAGSEIRSAPGSECCQTQIRTLNRWRGGAGGMHPLLPLKSTPWDAILDLSSYRFDLLRLILSHPVKTLINRIRTEVCLSSVPRLFIPPNSIRFQGTNYFECYFGLFACEESERNLIETSLATVGRSAVDHSFIPRRIIHFFKRWDVSFEL